jgi:hypothetical protein
MESRLSGVGQQRVRFVLADLFGWRPDHPYDVVFFGFWLSHVPTERFAPFLSLVADCLQPDGRVFFVDDGYRTDDELIEGEHSPVSQRRLTDGTAYRIVKVPTSPQTSNSSSTGSVGASRSIQPPGRSTGATETACGRRRLRERTTPTRQRPRNRGDHGDHPLQRDSA